jgi:hypothetical protein
MSWLAESKGAFVAAFSPSTGMSSLPLRALCYFLLATSCIFLLFTFRSSLPAASGGGGPKTASWYSRTRGGDVYENTKNATLGVSCSVHGMHSLLVLTCVLQFERLFMLNMPERSDKRDAAALAASLTGLKLEYIDGVNGATIPDKALPSGQEKRPMSNTTYGSWRAHVNALR